MHPFVFSVPIWISGFLPSTVGFQAEDSAHQLARLSNPSAAERAAAQRYLAAHLRSADRPALEAALKAGTPETRGRIVEALASEDRLVGLSVALAASTDVAVSSAGREALVEAVLRWSPDAHDNGLDGSALRTALRAKRTTSVIVDATLASAPLDDVLDLLARHAPLGAALAVDPIASFDASPAAASAIDGPVDDVLLELAERRALAPLGFGLAEDAPAGSPPWILLVPRQGFDARSPGASTSSTQESAAQRIVGWCLKVEREGGERARSAAARALAACGWPAGVAWLAERWRARDDEAALDGVLLAARRGRVVPQLFDPLVQASLRTELEQALAEGTEGGARAIRIATALGSTGTRGSQGEDLLEPALRGLAELEGRALHARLVEIEARRSNGDAVCPALDAVLKRADVAVATLWLATEVRARATTPLAELPRARELVEWAARNGRLPDLARLVRGDAAFPPENWRDPQALPGSWTGPMRVLVARSWLARGALGAATAHLVRALASSDAALREVLAAALADAVADVDVERATAWFALVLESSELEPASTLRTVAEAGLARTIDLADRVLAVTADPATAREDLLALGALAAGPRGDVARERLLAAVRGTASVDDIVAALDRATKELRAARDEALERAFTRSVRELAREGPLSLRSRLRVDVWPAPPAAERVRLADFDRSFRRAGS